MKKTYRKATMLDFFTLEGLPRVGVDFYTGAQGYYLLEIVSMDDEKGEYEPRVSSEELFIKEYWRRLEPLEGVDRFVASSKDLVKYSKTDKKNDRIDPWGRTLRNKDVCYHESDALYFDVFDPAGSPAKLVVDLK